MSGTAERSGLVGDVGGTHARFALARVTGERVELGPVSSLPSRDFASLEAAIGAFLAGAGAGAERPRVAAVAVAGPVREGAAVLTNLGWRLSERGVAERCGLGAVRLLNDFAAAALALPALGPQDLEPLGPARPAPAGATLAVMGPGTGFGVAALVRGEGREIVQSGEGGHMGFAPQTDLEVEVLQALRSRFDRVSVERVLSGPGLAHIHAALAARRGSGSPPDADPEAIARAAEAGDPLAVEAVDAFCGALGAVAGDFALAFGAEGGVYLAGGVSLGLRARLEAGAFRARFEDKGRLSDYVRAVPTFLIRNPAPNLIGAARALPGA